MNKSNCGNCKFCGNCQMIDGVKYIDCRLLKLKRIKASGYCSNHKNIMDGFKEIN